VDIRVGNVIQFLEVRDRDVGVMTGRVSEQYRIQEEMEVGGDWDEIRSGVAGRYLCQAH